MEFKSPPGGYSSLTPHIFTYFAKFISKKLILETTHVIVTLIKIVSVPVVVRVVPIIG